MRKVLLSSVALIPFIASAPANATVVATIDGCYDCVVYDTPNITIENTSGGTLTNVTLTATPYQPGTLTYGLTPQSVSLPNIANGTNYNYTWLDGYSGTVKGDLFSYDFDDSYGNTPAGYTNANCVVGAALCSLVGNFSLTLTAVISGGTFNGDSVFSVFSPTTNKTGGFIGFEGLDPTGLSETVYDQHSGSTSTVNGELADIDIGTPPATPLPAALPLFGTGLGVLGLLGWRRKRKASGALATA